jgi:hypothetical protein
MNLSIIAIAGLPFSEMVDSDIVNTVSKLIKFNISTITANLLNLILALPGQIQKRLTHRQSTIVANLLNLILALPGQIQKHLTHWQQQAGGRS